jgi:glutaredoxin
LEDYVYEEIEEEKHKHELLMKLIERNKLINTQINNFVRKSCAYIPVPLLIIPNNKSSGDERN